MSLVREDNTRDDTSSSITSRDSSTRDSPLFVLEGNKSDEDNEDDEDDQLLRAAGNMFYPEGFDLTGKGEGSYSFR